MVNKSAASADTVVLERFTGDGYASEKVADCAYTVDGRYMTVRVRKSDIGLSGYDFTVNFAWTDNVHDADDTGTGDGRPVYHSFSGDILDFYTSGDAAPGGRFKFSYVSTAANAGAESDTATATETATGQDGQVPDSRYRACRSRLPLRPPTAKRRRLLRAAASPDLPGRSALGGYRNRACHSHDGGSAPPQKAITPFLAGADGSVGSRFLSGNALTAAGGHGIIESKNAGSGQTPG